VKLDEWRVDRKTDPPTFTTLDYIYKQTAVYIAKNTNAITECAQLIVALARDDDSQV